MASLISTYMRKEEQLQNLRKELEQLEGDSRLKVELEFKDKLTALLSEHDKTPEDVVEMLSPERPVASTDNRRKPRSMKVYLHPDTQEKIETKGGNHKKLKEWKSEYGGDVVESWRIDNKE